MTGGAAVAAPPMYDFPEIAEANDTLWRRIRGGLAARGAEAPARLTRGPHFAELWLEPGLVFGQTCGYPFVTALRGVVALLATPVYSFPGCDGPTHRSFIVCGAGDPRRALASFRGAVAAVNARDSNTGMNLFRAAIAPLAGGRAFFSEVVVTGSHAASLEAVGEGRADLAAIDCVTYGLLKRIRPDLVARTAIVAESRPSPGLPFIASARLPEARIAAAREALFEALADPDLAETRRALGLAGARPATAQDYLPVMEIERAALAAGYATLA